MATVILRPTSDLSLGHSCSSGSSGYALIADTSADGDSTYVYQSISSTSSSSVTSWFECSAASVGKIKISGITLTVNAKTTKGDSSDTAEITYLVVLNGSPSTSTTVGSGTLSTSYSNFTKTYSASDFGVADTVFDSFDAIKLGARVLTKGKKNQNKNDNFQNRITQVYLTLEYEPVSDTTTGIYLKQNGAYKQAQAAYKKVNGVWVQQTDIATLKTEMQSGKYKVST